MILAENKSGQQLLEYIKVCEKDLLESDVFKPVTGSFAFIRCSDKYLIAYNKWRKQWEFPAGKIEKGETYKECAIRELFEETNQNVTNLEYRGLFKIYDKNKSQVRYRTAYFAEIDKITGFKENDEMTEIMLWNLESDIGYFDEVDKKMLQLCVR
jgi:8-oxo-dGTP diphosphatase